MGKFSNKINRVNVKIIRFIRNIALFPKRVYLINDLINRDSYYDDRFERKSYLVRWLDNFIWILKYNELNEYYNSWGLDIKNFRNPNDFLSNNDFRIMRNEGNQKGYETHNGNYNYICLLRDKNVFAHYFSQTLGSDKVVLNNGLIINGKVLLSGQKETKDLSYIFDNFNELVIKSVNGDCGNNIYLYKKEDNKITIDGVEKTELEIKKLFDNDKYIFQDVVKQHNLIQAFGTKSVNTIRIITIRGKSGEINIFNAFLRLSVDKDSFVDNRAKGGLGIGINLETGKLFEYGMTHDSFGGIFNEHPISGIKFKDYQLPYWNALIDLVITAHKHLYEIESIGWDVAITENGPVLLEGNDDFEIGGPQDTYGGLRERWHLLRNM